jgi:hypothetical protein
MSHTPQRSHTCLTEKQRVGFEFPFIDILGDGYSSFRWVNYQLIEASNTAALDGSRDYGGVAEPGVFDPPCDAYRRTRNGANYFRGSSVNDSSIFAELDFFPLSRSGEVSPYPVELFKNITNQPSFGNGSTCDNQIRLFSTSLSQGEFAPVPVKGKVFASLPPFQRRQGLGDIYGLEVATPFIENNYLDCMSLKGYSGIDIQGA